jgi:hypothetical protein
LRTGRSFTVAQKPVVVCAAVGCMSQKEVPSVPIMNRGTAGALGGIRLAKRYITKFFDPVLNRTRPRVWN